MIIAIQQTAALIALISLAWMAFDPRDVGVIPNWQIMAVTIPFIVGLAVFVCTTLLRIWA